MDESFKLISVDPPYAIPGGEIAVTCQGFKMAAGSPDGCYIEGFQCRLVAASSTRLLAIVPDEIASGHCVALSRPRALAELLDGMWSGLPQ